MLKENLLALKSEQLPQYLAGLGLKPCEIAAVIYGVFKEVKLLGALTPGEDNAIHLQKEKLLKMAKDPILESALCDLFIKVQRMKSWDALFKKESKTTSLSVPDLRHNPHGAAPNLKSENLEEIEIIDFVKFLTGCGINPEIVKRAMEEKDILKGAAK